PAGAAPHRILLAGKAAVRGRAPLINVGGLAYARVAYPQAQAQALAERMAGYAPASNALAFLSRLPPDAEPVVWLRAVALLTDIDSDYPARSPGRTAFQARALKLLDRVSRHVGDAPKQ